MTASTERARKKQKQQSSSTELPQEEVLRTHARTRTHAPALAPAACCKGGEVGCLWEEFEEKMWRFLQLEIRADGSSAAATPAPAEELRTRRCQLELLEQRSHSQQQISLWRP